MIYMCNALQVNTILSLCLQIIFQGIVSAMEKHPQDKLVQDAGMWVKQ